MNGKMMRLSLILILSGLLLAGLRLFAFTSKAIAVPNPPIAMYVQPTVEQATQPTTRRTADRDVLLENPSAPFLPTLTTPLEVQHNGVTMRLEALEAQTATTGRIDTQICFSLPSTSMDWSIGEAWLNTSQGKWPVTLSTLLRYQREDDGTMWRCEVLTFEIPTGISQTPFRIERLVIASLWGPRREKPDCASIQKILDDEGIRIVSLQEEGLGGCRVVDKPATMTQEQAESRLAELLLPQRSGPWVFNMTQP